MIKFRPHTEKDIPYRAKWLNNPKANRLLGNHPGEKTTLVKQQVWFATYRKEKTKKFFTIYDDNRPIGFVGLSHIDKINKTAEIFVVIGEDDYRGKGIGRQAVQWIVDFGFKQLKLHKIALAVFAENLVAVKLYKSLGFKQEGTLKDDAYFGGKYHDTLLMAKFA